MKIAYISLNLFPSHYAHTLQILKMCQGFKQIGNDITLFARKSNLYISDELLFEEYGIKSKFDINWTSIPNNKWLFRFKVFTLLLQIKNNYDLIYTRNSFTSFCCLMLRKNNIFECHSTPISKLEKIIFPVLIKKSKVKIVTISKELSRLLSEKYNVALSRFTVEHDASDINTYGINMDDNNTSFMKKLTKNKPRVLYVGSFYKGRGIDLIIKLAKKNPMCNFICVGGNKDEISRINIESNNLILVERIPPKSIPSLLQFGDILLMPYSNVTTIEGENNTASFCSPMKLAEYLSSGKPIISSNLPSLREVLIHEINSILCEPDDVNNWHEKLNYLINNSNLIEKISSGAFKTASHLTWEKRAKRILKQN